MEQSAGGGEEPSPTAFFLKGIFQPFDDNFFEEDAPVVGEGDAQKIWLNMIQHYANPLTLQNCHLLTNNKKLLLYLSRYERGILKGRRYVYLLK